MTHPVELNKWYKIEGDQLFNIPKLNEEYPEYDNTGFGFTKDFFYYHSKGQNVKLFKITKFWSVFYE